MQKKFVFVKVGEEGIVDDTRQIFEDESFAVLTTTTAAVAAAFVKVQGIHLEVSFRW